MCPPDASSTGTVKVLLSQVWVSETGFLGAPAVGPHRPPSRSPPVVVFLLCLFLHVHQVFLLERHLTQQQASVLLLLFGVLDLLLVVFQRLSVASLFPDVSLLRVLQVLCPLELCTVLVLDQSRKLVLRLPSPIQGPLYGRDQLSLSALLHPDQSLAFPIRLWLAICDRDGVVRWESRALVRLRLALLGSLLPRTGTPRMPMTLRWYPMCLHGP